MVSGETGDNSGAEKDVFSSAQFSVDRRRRRRRPLVGRRRRHLVDRCSERQRSRAEAVAPYLIPPILHAAATAAAAAASKSEREGQVSQQAGTTSTTTTTRECAGRSQCVASLSHVSRGNAPSPEHHETPAPLLPDSRLFCQPCRRVV